MTAIGWPRTLGDTTPTPFQFRRNACAALAESSIFAVAVQSQHSIVIAPDFPRRHISAENAAPRIAAVIAIAIKDLTVCLHKLRPRQPQTLDKFMSIAAYCTQPLRYLKQSFRVAGSDGYHSTRVPIHLGTNVGELRAHESFVGPSSLVSPSGQPILTIRDCCKVPADSLRLLHVSVRRAFSRYRIVCSAT